MFRIGVIGYGKRINVIAELLVNSGECEVEAIADTDCERVKSRFPALASDIRYYTDAEEMLRTEALDGVLIGTRCSSHTRYALLVAKYNLPLYIEKPVCTTYEDLYLLKNIPHMNEKTVVSFPLRCALVVERVKKLVESERIGKLTQVQAYNNVPYGGNYFHKWYRDVAETGGMFLQKATHDVDYINYVIGRKPIRVCAMSAQIVYGGDKPAALRCKDCPDVATCTEAPIVNAAKNDLETYDYCSFATDVGIEDVNSMLIEYADGVHAAYTQNFVARCGAKKRGARFIGYNGTLEFDFYTGEIRIFDHFTDTEELITVADDGSHFGGDKLLADGLIAVMKDGTPSLAPLCDGIVSAEICLAARESAHNHVFVDLS